MAAGRSLGVIVGLGKFTFLHVDHDRLMESGRAAWDSQLVNSHVSGFVLCSPCLAISFCRTNRI